MNTEEERGMLREIVRASLIFVMLVVPMCAAVLTFQISDATNNQSTPQTYGDISMRSLWARLRTALPGD